MERWFGMGLIVIMIYLIGGENLLPIPEQVHIALGDDFSSMIVQVGFAVFLTQSSTNVWILVGHNGFNSKRFVC